MDFLKQCLKLIQEFWFWLQKRGVEKAAKSFFYRHDFTSDDLDELRELFPIADKPDILRGHVHYDKYDLEGKFKDNTVWIIFYKSRWQRNEKSAVIRYEVNGVPVNRSPMSKVDKRYLAFVINAWLHLHNLENAEPRFRKKLRTLA